MVERGFVRFDTALIGTLDAEEAPLPASLRDASGLDDGALSDLVTVDATASRAIVSDADGKLTVSAVTSVEVGYLDGVTSSIQDQITAKAAKGANSDITSLSGLTTPLTTAQGGTGVASITASRALVSDGDGKVSASAATATEAGYLSGVTSAIQTQINAKAPLASPTFTGTVAGITKSMVGLGNADDTSDANKPISTATQAALDIRLVTFATKVDAEAATIPANVKRIRTQFRNPSYADLSTMTGGADFKRASLADLTGVSNLLYFRSTDRFLPDGTTDATNGGYWLVDGAALDPAVAGAGRGVMADDTYAWQACIDFSASHKIPIVDPGRTYLIDGYKGAQASWTTGEWAHGGLIVRDGAVIRGAGRGKTTLKNGADNWRCVLRLRDGVSTITGITVDGDIANHANIILGSTTSSAGTVRGETIILEGGGSLQCYIDNVECKNAGHYAIGVQDASCVGGLIQNVHFSNIGGDCIDIKESSSPVYGKKLKIDGVFAPDGCGHNYVGGSGVSPHDNQAVVDIGGQCQVTNVFIGGLDSYGTQIGNCGVRLRAPVTAENRLGAEGSQVRGVYVKSSKLTSEGSGTVKRIMGVVVNCGDVHVSDVYADGCFYGLRAYATADGTPTRVALSNITAKNCVGASTDAVGIDIASDCRDVKATNLIADGCETGVRLSGQRGSYHGISAINNTVYGLDASDDVLAANTISGLFFSGNAADMNAVRTPSTASSIFPVETAIVGTRKVWQDFVSTANDASWSSDNIWLGGLRFFGNDASGQVGELIRLGVKATGSSGAGWYTELQAASSTTVNIPVARAREGLLEVLLPLQIPSYTVATLPSAATFVRCVIYVSDGTSNKRFAISDGSNWRWPDGVIVS